MKRGGEDGETGNGAETQKEKLKETPAAPTRGREEARRRVRRVTERRE